MVTLSAGGSFFQYSNPLTSSIRYQLVSVPEMKTDEGTMLNVSMVTGPCLTGMFFFRRLEDGISCACAWGASQQKKIISHMSRFRITKEVRTFFISA
jgi:hypothetical protein